jgi:Zn finger protein HypA/HybF involved in hydrogenase expression
MSAALTSLSVSAFFGENKKGGEAMKLKNIVRLKCLRCGHEWTPRQQEVRQCPHCKSALWDVPKESR